MCVLLVFAKHFIIMVTSVSYSLRIYEFDTARWLQIASRYPNISVWLFIFATRSRSIIQNFWFVVVLRVSRQMRTLFTVLFVSFHPVLSL